MGQGRACAGHGVRVSLHLSSRPQSAGFRWGPPLAPPQAMAQSRPLRVSQTCPITVEIPSRATTIIQERACDPEGPNDSQDL